MMKWQIILAILGIGIFVGGLVWFSQNQLSTLPTPETTKTTLKSANKADHVVSQRKTKVAEAISPSKEIATNPQNNQCNGAHLYWKAGDKRMYALNQTLDLETNPGILASDVGEGTHFSKQKIRNQGILNVAVYDVEDDSALLGFQYNPTVFSIDNNNWLYQLEELYKTFFLVRFQVTGRPLEFYFPEGLSKRDQTILSEFIRSVQVVTHSEAESATWEIEEENSAGTYEALYKISGTDCTQFHKEKTQYLTVNNLSHSALEKSEGQLEKKLFHSQFEGTIGTNQSWINEFQGTEQSETWYQGAIVSRDHLTIELKSIAFAPDPDLEIWQANLNVIELVHSYQKLSDPHKSLQGFWERQTEENLRESFNNVTLELVLSTLSGLVQANAPREQLHGMQSTLRDFFIAFPNEVFRVPKHLKQFVTSDEKGLHGSIITEALAKAGHYEAQQVLTQIMADDSQQHQHRLTAIINSGFLEDHQPFVIEQLKALVHFKSTSHSPEQWDLASTSLLALGVSSLFLLEQNNRALAENSIDFIKGFLNKAKTDSEKAIAVSALANVRDEALLTTLQPYLGHSSEVVRENAIRAFQFYPSEESTQILSNQFREDSSWKVRSLAFKALTERSNPSIVEKIHEHLNTETFGTLRIAMIEYLGQHIQTDSTIEETLKQQLHKSSSKDEVKAIYEAIARR